jgi:hypothetical protein
VPRPQRRAGPGGPADGRRRLRRARRAIASRARPRPRPCERHPPVAECVADLSGTVFFGERACDGPADETWCAFGCDITPGLELNKDPAGRGRLPPGGDLLLPFEDWPNLLFGYQCASTYNDGAAPGFLAGGEMTSDQALPDSPARAPAKHRKR